MDPSTTHRDEVILSPADWQRIRSRVRGRLLGSLTGMAAMSFVILMSEPEGRLERLWEVLVIVMRMSAVGVILYAVAKLLLRGPAWQRARMARHGRTRRHTQVRSSRAEAEVLEAPFTGAGCSTPGARTAPPGPRTADSPGKPVQGAHPSPSGSRRGPVDCSP